MNYFYDRQFTKPCERIVDIFYDIFYDRLATDLR